MCWYNHSLCLMFIVRVMCPKEFLLNIISTCFNDWCAFGGGGDTSHYLEMLFYHKVEIVQVILTRTHNVKNPKMDGHIPLGKKYLTITADLILIYLDTKHHWMLQINKKYIYSRMLHGGMLLSPYMQDNFVNKWLILWRYET